MALRPCLTSGCTELADGTYCEAHRRSNDRKRNAARPWYRGEWSKIRAKAIAQQPWCSFCGATTDLTVDHIDPRSLDAGVQVLCRPCNSSKGGKR